MRSPSPILIGVLASVSLTLTACSAEPTAPPAAESSMSGGAILTSFDRLTLSRGGRSSFRASLVGAGARISSAGLTFVSRTASVARVSAVRGRAQVEGIAAGRTWVLVQSAGAADSVEVIVQ
jgi:hypothetical protein